MRLTALALIASTGCSPFFMEKAPIARTRGKPVYCSGNKGFVAADALYGAAHSINAIAMFALAGQTASDSTSAMPKDNGIFIGFGVVSVALAITHFVSAGKGNSWANDCRDARAEYDDTIVVKPEPVAPVVPPKAIVKAPIVAPPVVTRGTKPLYCAPGGECWRDEAACTGTLAAAPGATCETRRDGACFTATGAGDKREVCSVSLEDCETRRQALTTAPDYKVGKCALYEVMKGW